MQSVQLAAARSRSQAAAHVVEMADAVTKRRTSSPSVHISTADKTPRREAIQSAANPGKGRPTNRMTPDQKRGERSSELCSPNTLTVIAPLLQPLTKQESPVVYVGEQQT